MRFVAFEGLDGSGKSTLIRGLTGELDRRGITHTLTREPGGTPLGEDIRRLLLRLDGQAPVPRAEVLLYQADRAQDVETVIRPALAAGRWVIADRFAAASHAFQAGGRSVSEEEISWLNQFSTAGLQPDLYVLLDLSVEESRRRLEARGEADRFEREKDEFHARVRQSYLRMAAGDRERWLVLDAAQSPAVLVQSLIHMLVARRWLA